MQATRKIMEQIINASKISQKPAYISYPVLRSEDNKIYLAAFSIEFDDSEKECPQVCITMDIENGQMKTSRICKKTNFSKIMLQGKNASEEFNDQVYGLMDGIRQSLIEGVPLSDIQERYTKYMNTIIGAVSNDYKILYKDLSNIMKDENPVRKNYIIDQVRWNPEKNLSDIPEMLYTIAEQIAEYIKFLPMDAPNVIRYEYPDFCLEKDQEMICNPWSELLVKLHTGYDRKRHYKTTTKKKTILTTCMMGQSKGCIFGCCPYFIAAYIRFLKDFHPEELKRQRDQYKKNRFAIDAKGLNRLKCKIQISKNAEKEKVKSGLSLVDSGKFFIIQKDNVIRISYIDGRLETAAQVNENEISIEDVNNNPPDQIKDVNGNIVNEEWIYALYAVYLVTNGMWNDFFNKKSSNIKEVKSSEIKDSKIKVKPVKTQEKKTESNHTNFSYVGFDLGKDEYKGTQQTYAYRCANDPECRSFYGIYQYTDNSDLSAVNDILRALKTRGAVSGWEMVELNKLPEKFDQNILYIVNDIRTKKVPEILEIFATGCFVLLCGDKADVESLLDASPIIQEMYTKCMLYGNKPDVQEVYQKVYHLLPESLKRSMKNASKEQLADWIHNNILPRNVESAAEYIAWRCTVERKIVFKVGDIK
ncbi:hypothetical protein [Blautia faecicola]|uniref:Uncharacterized protein n=1 Tax=Blautia faecicola TaxID=2509240 RepID=A0A4Q1RD70_9FIRM|nr:hypothetical protein [Blautia faecicola]RXS72588.1 hypothetical protein ETP43_16550 [Blautia faecicola]